MKHMISRLRSTVQHLASSTAGVQRVTASMSTFALPSISPEVSVTLPNGSDVSAEELLKFPAFKSWLSTIRHSLALQQNESHTFHGNPYKLRGIEIQSVDRFGGARLGFVKLKAEITNDTKEKLPGSVFLRGGSVAMLVRRTLLTSCLLLCSRFSSPETGTDILIQLILQSENAPQDSETDKYVILCVQPRVPAGSLAFTEIPAGMLDDSGTFAGAAAKEISEETGLEIAASEFLDMTRLALSPSEGGEELQSAVYPSCGGSDEYIPLFLWQKRVPKEQLKEWQGKLTGLRDHGEKITLQLARLEDMWKVAGRDAKALAAWALYHGLKQEGKI